MMLSKGIPRAFKESRSREARSYREYCLGKVARYSKIPKDALPILREAGLATIELERLHMQAEHAREKNRRADERRIRRAIASQRSQLMCLEKRLEELASNGDRTPQAREIFNVEEQR